jgi:hypothetical protein
MILTWMRLAELDAFLQAAGTSAGDIDAVSGKFFLDRQPAATHLSMAGTQESKSERAKLWAECEKLFDLDTDATATSPPAPAPAAAAASSASSARA